jgi:hypothetical protein
MIGKFIGVGGKNSKLIQKQFDLDIFHFNDRQHSDLNEQLLFISGDEENVKKAMQYSIDKLNNGRKLDKNLSYRQFHVTSQEGAVDHDQDSEDAIANFSRVKITVPFCAVPALIGTNGHNIKKISRNCYTMISVSRNGENFPGSKEQVVLIEGKSMNVIQTVQDVSDFLRGFQLSESYERNDRDKKRLRGINLVVPSAMVGKFIGLGGKKAKVIQKRFHLDMFHFNDRQHSDLNEQIVSISGDEENVKEAMQYSIDKLNNGRKLDKNLSYRQFHVTSQEGAVDHDQDSEDAIADFSRVKITVPFCAVPALIGTKGENIKKISRNCDTIIFTSGLEENFPCSREQVVLIEGYSKNVVKTVHQVYDFLRGSQIPEGYEQNDGYRKRLKGVNLVVPNVMAGSFMGAGGKTAAQIQKRFNLDIYNIHDQQHSDLNEQLLYISGDEKNVKETIEYLIEKLDYGPKLDKNLSYQQFYSTFQDGTVAHDQHSDSENVTNLSRVKITVPFWTVQALIGTKGENIKKISRNCDTIIFTSGLKENFPGSRERVVLIEGDSKNVVKTVHQVYDFLRGSQLPERYEQNDGARKRLRGVNMVVPSVMADMFIGASGKTDNEIQKQFDLDIFHSQDQQLSDLNERLICISGDDKNVKEAIEYLIDELNYGPKLDKNISYQQF